LLSLLLDNSINTIIITKAIAPLAQCNAVSEDKLLTQEKYRCIIRTIESKIYGTFEIKHLVRVTGYKKNVVEEAIKRLKERQFPVQVADKLDAVIRAEIHAHAARGRIARKDEKAYIELALREVKRGELRAHKSFHFAASRLTGGLFEPFSIKNRAQQERPGGAIRQLRTVANPGSQGGAQFQALLLARQEIQVRGQVPFLPFGQEFVELEVSLASIQLFPASGL